MLQKRCRPLGLLLALHLLWAAQAQPGSLEQDTQALLAFKGGLQNPSVLSSWGAGQDPCATGWRGVNCTAGRVTSLQLPGLALRGTLAAGLSGMDALQLLDLSRNQLSGSLPMAWSFASLQSMQLGENKLTGELPPAWASSMPGLQGLELQGSNTLEGTMPAGWVAPAGFDTPFTAVLQPGNAQLCGPVSPSPGHTLLYNSSGLQYSLVTSLGSCAQGSCGKAFVNSTAPNMYDISWANRAAPLDVAAFNDVPPTSVPLPGTPVVLPCYPVGAPTNFGSNVAYQKASWQSSTEAGQGAALAVAGQGQPTSTTQCSTTSDSPGWWVVDMQQSTYVQTVLLWAGAAMAGVEVRVGNDRNATANPLCTSGISLAKGNGGVYVCRDIVKGRYLSVVATQSKVSLCRVEVYPLSANAALGKYTKASSGDASAVTNGNAASNQCSSVTSSQDLATWIAIDLGYTAQVSTVVISNGGSTFNNDLFISLGDNPVFKGDENKVQTCTQGITLQPFNTLPVPCSGNGRYLTLWVDRAQASTLYICEVWVYLSAGPLAFGPTSPYAPAPSPPPSPSTPSPSPQPCPSPPIACNVTAPSITKLDTLLLLGGGNVSLASDDARNNLVAALESVWTPALGISSVVFLNYKDMASQALVEVAASTPAGQALTAANNMVETVGDGQVLAALNAKGAGATSVSLQSVAAFPSPPGPSPGPDVQPGSGGSSTPIGAIVGGVFGGVALLAVATALLMYWKRRKAVPDSPKVLNSMEQGRLGGPPLMGGKDGAAGLDVAAVSGNGSESSKLLLPREEDLTQGPPEEVLSFLSQDPLEALALSQNGGNGMAPAASSSSLDTQRPLAHVGSGVSELWLVKWPELDVQRKIGGGSSGKVHLAKWRETTVAVKVLEATRVSSSLEEEEFPSNSPGHRHPLLDSLQKEAAMMASLRHPSIVMYLGVCLEPPAVVTEYCARGSLFDVLERARASLKPGSSRPSSSLASQLDWPRRLNMALDAAKGMLYLHSCTPPIIHRDLKSPNLLVDKHWRVKVCDFNLSRVMEGSAVESSLQANNPRWLAPEILSGKGSTFASDIYAFGICLWELLTWRVPWNEENASLWSIVREITDEGKRPEVPPSDELPTPPFAGQADYLELMTECWAQDPTQRPSFATVISRLRKMLASELRQRSVAASTPRYPEASGGSGAWSRPTASSCGFSNSPTKTPSSFAAQPRYSGDITASFTHRTSDDVTASRTSVPGFAVTLESLATLQEAVAQLEGQQPQQPSQRQPPSVEQQQEQQPSQRQPPSVEQQQEQQPSQQQPPSAEQQQQEQQQPFSVEQQQEQQPSQQQPFSKGQPLQEQQQQHEPGELDDRQQRLPSIKPVRVTAHDRQ